MYVLVAESGGCEFVLTSRETEYECEQLAYDMNWEYVDENGFSWNLYVVSYEEFRENHPLEEINPTI